jgi:hypothetical protein
MTSTTLVQTTSVSPDEAADIAVDAYVYAFPLVMMDATRRAGVDAGMEANEFNHQRIYSDAALSSGVRPNVDTLYSTLFFDVSDEPLLVNVPESGDRYYLLSLLDMWTEVFAAPGSRTTGKGARSFVIVAPDWDGPLPTDASVIRAPTPYGWLVGRIQTDEADVYEGAHEFQDRLEAIPVSLQGMPSLSTSQLSCAGGRSPVAQVEGMDAAQFFARFVGLASANPAHACDDPILARMKRIGIEPGCRLDLLSLEPAVRSAVETAPRRALQMIRTSLSTAARSSNGWRLPSGPTGTYGADYLRRAAIAYFGLGANRLEDATFVTATCDVDGARFDAEARYRIHFEVGGLPPAHAFWSLTLYNESQLFAENPIDRYAIGDRDGLQYNDNGSLDICIQRRWPGEAKECNWLPTPVFGPFSLTLRMYWPDASALDGTWTPPTVRRVG